MSYKISVEDVSLIQIFSDWFESHDISIAAKLTQPNIYTYVVKEVRQKFSSGLCIFFLIF